ncbi:hypothetical protein Pla108_03810 [Botrimarina colliarenosi]|uniref:Uncharacterized protein n=1 Tax=Botrimarina colliarenosi TaxID=2528001 RepID=A0A5C6AHD0_9BACT|nr:hypothetical protein Pla108_03810 [Botrimarina colliarenosi]
MAAQEGLVWGASAFVCEAIAVPRAGLERYLANEGFWSGVERESPRQSRSVAGFDAGITLGPCVLAALTARTVLANDGSVRISIGP